MKQAGQFSFFIETLGCPKNRVDSRSMRAALLQHGFRESAEAKNANILLINTCSFIREAQEETIDTIFTALQYKKEDPDRIVGVVGCFAQQFPEAVQQEIPEADFVLGTGRYHEIPHLLSEQFSIALQPQPFSPSANQAANAAAGLPYAYFRLGQGCSRQCAFCVIPSIRGPLMSYDPENIKKQFEEELSLRGGAIPPEVILVSQDTVATPIDDLQRTIEYFSKMEEVRWVRLHYLFPDKRIFKILELFRQYPKITPYLDIPFQHVSPRVLEKMKRPGNPEFFNEIMDAALEARPDMEFRSSFILGFPGEKESDVDQIIRFLDDAPLHKLALFRYSHEEASPAASLNDDVDEGDKIERLNLVRNYHLEKRRVLREKLIDQTEKMLVEEFSEDEITARRAADSPEIDEVVIVPRQDANPAAGDFIDITLKVAMEYDWLGEISGNNK